MISAVNVIPPTTDAGTKVTQSPPGPEQLPSRELRGWEAQVGQQTKTNWTNTAHHTLALETQALIPQHT